MNFKEILKRITGISTPVFGISWNPENTERDHARQVLAFLEDRRVLYNPYVHEVDEQCNESVLQIRSLLTEKIGKLDQNSELSLSLRAMRAACRKYLDGMEISDDISLFPPHRMSDYHWRIHDYIGELRGVFGVHIAKIAVAYGIDIEENLASIIPGMDADEKNLLKDNKNPPHRKLRSSKKRIPTP